MPAQDGELTSEVTGEIEKTDDGVLVIRRIHVRYRLAAREMNDRMRGAIDRALSIHVDRCPVARTIRPCVDVSTEIEIVEPA